MDSSDDRRKYILNSARESIDSKSANAAETVFFNSSKFHHIGCNLLIIHLGVGDDWGNASSIEAVQCWLTESQNLHVIGYSGSSRTENGNGNRWDALVAENGELKSFKDRIHYCWNVNTGKELNWRRFFTCWKTNGFDMPPPFDELENFSDVNVVYALLKLGWEAARGKHGGEVDEARKKETETKDWWRPLLDHPQYKKLNTQEKGRLRLPDCVHDKQVEQGLPSGG